VKATARVILAVLCVAVTAATARAQGDGDLVLRPGMDGACSSWLVLGPIRAPAGALKSEGGLAGWDPLGASSSRTTPVAGTRSNGALWSAQLSREPRIALKGKGPAVAYLAAVLRAEGPRRLAMMIGRDGGLEVSVDGALVLSREEERRGDADTDLVPLELHAGDNAILIRAWKTGGGRWSPSIRLLDEQYRRPRGVLIVLAGAGRLARRAIASTASMRVERDVLLPEPRLRVRYWLEFRGARPVTDHVEGRLAFAGGRRGDERVFALDLAAEGLPFELLAEETCAAGACPASMTAQIGGSSLGGQLGVRMGDVEKLARAAAAMSEAARFPELPRTSVESVEWRIAHLEELLEAGDRDFEYLFAELGETVALAGRLASGEDPYAGRRGEVQRRGYRSSVDGRLHPYALYVPPGWTERGERRYGLVVALHGLDSQPMKTLTSLFGVPLGETETKGERERHPPEIGDAPMFAVAPEGFGNSGYAAYGERDVEEVVARVMERYRIAPESVYVTGASMGGIGAASIPLHRPDLFAAAAPLCGYHSLFEYGSLRGVALEPWERFLAEFGSNASWARNGRHLPLYVVHGTRDGLRHSKSLVEAYRLNGYDVTFETPEAGHNVWDETYEGRRIFAHFARYRRAADPRKVSFVTSRTRYRQSGWIRIDDVEDHAAWARVEGEREDAGGVVLRTENVSAVTVLRQVAPGTGAVVIDGAELRPEAAGEEARFHREGDAWVSGPAPPCAGPCKRPGLAGPIGDADYEPLIFVYGTADPDETALARRVIERLRVPRAGTTIEWPVEADVEISERDIRDNSLVIVGTARGNSLLARIAGRLPIVAEEGAVVAGGRRFEGDTVAAAFIHPNPLNPDRYVVVHTGASRRALFYANHLPRLLPDWVVYDAAGWQHAGGLVLDGREVLGAGFFDRSWRLPAQKP
jgi:poly(3-hydroxybutyrate) depolymerase